MSDEIKPCPFCGSHNVSAGEIMGHNTKDFSEYKQSSCLDCGAAGPEVPFDYKDRSQLFDDTGCIKAWNTRPALTDEQVHLIASRIACDMAGQIDWEDLADKRSHIDMMTAAGKDAIREAIGRGERG